MYILILVASEKFIDSSLLFQLESFLPTVSEPVWLAPKKAIELPLKTTLSLAQRRELKELLASHKIDHFLVSAAQPRRKKLLLCDMDSTIVEGETLDDLAASIGLKDEIATITAKAMAGELDFGHALDERVAMLKGMSKNSVDKETARLHYVRGAWELVQTMATHGAHCVLVSGGFTCFTEAVANTLGFHQHHGNELLFAQGIATGKVRKPILNCDAKREILTSYCQKLNLREEEVLAVGDGANDLDMLRLAGLGVGFHPKPFLYERVVNSIVYGDLRALLYIQGFSEKEIARRACC